MSGSVAVVGSINMDLVVRAPAFPRPGESILGAGFAMHPGGKGANQAVAAARLGAEVHLVGAVGADDWGKDLRACFAREGVDIEHVASLEDTPTGVGLVTVVEGGENAILVASGANLALTAEHVDSAHTEIAGADFLLLQNEVPMAANLRAADIAHGADTRIVYNHAPAGDVPPEFLERVYLLVANRVEAQAFAGCDDDVSAAGLARRLAAKGPALVAVTLGKDGAVLFDGETIQRAEAPLVDAIDAVGAGDAFVSSLALSLAAGLRRPDALRFACVAGALAATVEGAIPSLPQREAVEAYLARGSRADG